ncbi:MAG: hypothetical protein P1P93_05445 [Gammaproteobacteria bacterium]|nr:hypothetical protein [Gammaproteobacteria bacterium]MDT8370828.1 hypothetical protein [Gammaproteobacteria bacterium]
MNKSNPQHTFRLVLSLLIALLFIGCNDNQPSETGHSSILTLDKSNIKTFASRCQKDYDSIHAGLIEHFNIAYKNNDGYGFADFRNNKWTPAYIEKKNFYADVYAHNEAFLKSSPIAPLFDRFDNLIYIGINLKNGLLNNDKELIDQTLAEAKVDQQLVHSIVAATQ